MYCENCGKQIEDGSKFCRYCGLKIDSTEILAGAVGSIEIADAAALTTDMPETGTEGKKRKGRKGIIAAIAGMIVTAAAILIGFSIYNKPENRLARALDLGQRYLLEENYEQAIVEFNRAIEIDSKNEEAYIGLAEAYVETDDLEKAVRVLEKGAEKIDSEELQEMLEKYAEELTKEEAVDTVAETGETESSKDSAAEASKVPAEEQAMESEEAEAPAQEERAMESEEPEAPAQEERAMESEEPEAPAQEERAMEPEEPAAPAEEQTMENESAGVRTERYDYDGGYRIATYDGNGNIIKAEYYNADGSLSNYVLYTYDGNGNIIKAEGYNGNGSLREYLLHTYDGNGNCIKEEWYNADGSLQSVREY